MGFGAVLTLAVGLAMDAAAVSVARGLLVPRVELRHAVRIALFFGGFQALMPLLAWGAGKQLGPILQRVDHYVAFGLLVAIGGKTVWDALRGSASGPASANGDPFAPLVLFLLALATSIDAFAVGLTLPMLGAPFAASLAAFGVTTALLSAAALYMGRRFGALLGRRLDAAGGFLLIAIGVWVLRAHLGGEP